MSDLVLARNCCLARLLPGEAENGVGMNRSLREGKTCEALEQSSNGVDTALYKKIPLHLPTHIHIIYVCIRTHART